MLVSHNTKNLGDVLVLQTTTGDMLIGAYAGQQYDFITFDDLYKFHVTEKGITLIPYNIFSEEKSKTEINVKYIVSFSLNLDTKVLDHYKQTVTGLQLPETKKIIVS